MARFSLRLPNCRCALDVLRLATVATVAASGAALGSNLDDTGQSACRDVNGTAQPCANAGADGRYGRDAAAALGAMTKIGTGAAGFDFTKIANNGNALAAGAALGSNPGDWACTRDNVTGLIWEIKTDYPFDLRFVGNAYTWYSTAANNGGAAGSTGWDSCNGSLAAYGNLCNTYNYTLAVNAATLCGHNDWRLPTIKELQSIKHFGTGDPAIDTDYFPNTTSSVYWSANSYAPAPTDAWVENFSGAQDGNTSSTSSDKGAGLYLRLVRGGGGP